MGLERSKSAARSVPGCSPCFDYHGPVERLRLAQPQAYVRHCLAPTPLFAGLSASRLKTLALVIFSVLPYFNRPAMSA